MLEVSGGDGRHVYTTYPALANPLMKPRCIHHTLPSCALRYRTTAGLSSIGGPAGVAALVFVRSGIFAKRNRRLVRGFSGIFRSYFVATSP